MPFRVPPHRSLRAKLSEARLRAANTRNSAVSLGWRVIERTLPRHSRKELGYEELARYLEEGAGSGAAEARLQRIALAYVTFALDHPGRFRLMFRHDLIDRSDARYQEISMRALSSLALAAQGTGAPDLDLADPEVAGRVFTAWSTIHGMAHLVIEDKAQYIFPEPDTRRIVDEILPGLLAGLWSDMSAMASPDEATRGEADPPDALS